jgi:hypothetical protein
MITPKQMELIKIAVDAYKLKLTVEVEKLNANEGKSDMDELASTVSNLTVNTEFNSVDVSLRQIYPDSIDTDDVSVSTEDCNLCFQGRNELNDSNFFLQTNCPCEIRACFECWGKYYFSKNSDEFINCPKCRRDITQFLVCQGFKKKRLCSHCRLAGHNITSCPLKLAELA